MSFFTGRKSARDLQSQRSLDDAPSAGIGRRSVITGSVSGFAIGMGKVDQHSRTTPMAALSGGGTRLQDFLDGLPVETRWIAGHHIVWQTGQQNGPDGGGPQGHTHCSAFVAAVALYLDVYVLRPPNHSQELLSNAQMDWLGGKPFPGPSAADAGWRGLGSASDPSALHEAVAAANAGKLVIAGYRQPPVNDPGTGKLVGKPGHVVIVRSQAGKITPETGPFVTMAGNRNWRLIHMAPAFGSHPGAWPDAIRLYVHDTDLEKDFTAAQGIG